MSPKKIGITGQNGFIGTHLANTLGLYKEKYEIIPFADNYFESEELLHAFVQKCDVIVHLAAVNRHADPAVIYDMNIQLVKKIIEAFKITGSTPHVVFASSTQEERDNPYGRSKKEGRLMLADWADRNGGIVTGMILPNVFGPFGNPYYNSVVATFCHQLTHNENPRIDIDADLKLIYIAELIDEIIKVIDSRLHEPELNIKHTAESNVTGLLAKLQEYKEKYFENGIFPELITPFEVNLFNTFRCYIDMENHFPVNFKQHTDTRGSFVETVKSELSGQTSFSTTVPGITRGNHFHTRKIERFAVIKGEAEICLRRIGTDKIFRFRLSGKEPAYVDMPVWYTHNITNVGDEELYTIFWINEFYNHNDTDTFFEDV